MPAPLLQTPFVLLDDARAHPARPARLYRSPRELVIARHADEVGPALARVDALVAQGRHVAGMIAYEAGLALEPRLAARAGPRIGALGPLVWFGAFDRCEDLPDLPAWLAGEGDGPASLGPLDPALALGAYARAFADVNRAIVAGEIYQANLTFPLAGAYAGDPLALYASLRAAGGGGHGGVLFDGSHWLLSLSPELFFATDGTHATVSPMKGTRPREAEPAADARAAAALAASEKDRAENLMIVDLMRNDLSRVALPGTVRVAAPFAIESYPTVHQLVSTITATLAPGRGAGDLLRALFPCGSITGAPKISAMERIDAVERDARGPYCGALGAIAPTGEAAFNVAIRTLRLTPDPGGSGRGQAVLGVGSGIVADSQVLAEWRECLVKGGFVRSSAAGFDLIETMAFTPDEGIALLELHLERAKASAAQLGFGFDRHAVRNAIQALCFDAETPAKVRLMVARSGAHSLEIAPPPAPLGRPAVCAVLPLPVDPGDLRLRHKTSDRSFYAAALRAAHAVQADEALFLDPDGRLTEGSFTNLFVERGGVLLTPPAARGLLPGVLRRSLIEQGRAREADLTLDDLAAGFLLGNALRGLFPATLLG